MNINYNKKNMWMLFKTNFLNNNIPIKEICKELNIHKGTVNRWILKQEVPPQYFNDFNRMLNNKYKLNATVEEKYKIMDQFFTPENEAKLLIKKTIHFIQSNWGSISDYSFIEPSAGDGAFYKNIPKEFNKIGLDIDPKNKQIIKKDWFNFIPKTKKNIVIGNPPFGLRGQLALKFINKAAEHSDFICFILPPLFNSNGKGSPMLRINKDFYLAKEIKVNNTDFIYPSGEKVIVNSIFQIWTRLFSPKIKPITLPIKVSEWIKVYSLSNGNTSSSRRNIKMIDKCDFYLPSTTFNKVEGYKAFSNLPHNRGYGIVIKKGKKQIESIIKKINWDKESFKSTNGANNLRTQIIIDSIERNI